MKFRPLGDRVVVRRIKEDTKTAGGIIIPDTAQEKPQEGEVISVGPGALDDNGKRVVPEVKAGDFVHSLGDAHLYSNHLDQARLQLTRPTRPLPVMKINPDVKDIFAFRYEDFALEGYDPHPHIKAAVAV